MSDITDQMGQCATWLAAARGGDGGWGEEPTSAHKSALNTAEAVIALIDADADEVDGDAVRDGLRFLREKQRPDGVDAGSWAREKVSNEGVDQPGVTLAHPDVVRTGLAVEAFVRAKVATTDSAVDSGVRWLLGRQNDDGGWGVVRGGHTRLLPTCSALSALMAVFGAGEVDTTKRRAAAPDIAQAVDAGIAYLTGVAQHRRGFFSTSRIADNVAAAHTIHAALVLQRARATGFVRSARAERRAINWLLASQDEARRLVVEEVELDPANRYPFLHVTDTMLIRLLSGSSRAGDRKSLLFRAALYSVKDRIEPDRGACYGFRLFTWSTSRAVSAMSAAAEWDDDFPERPVEYSKSVSRLLTWIMAGIIALAFVLGVLDRFSPVTAGFFMFVVLVMLLANQLIGEKAFVQLAQAVLRGLGLGKGNSSGTEGA